MKRLLSLALVLCACGNDRLRRAAEGVEVVGGSPAVDTGLPGVDRADGGSGNVYGPAAPFQVDSFTQQQISKVDILWIIDDSPSMQKKQDRLKTNSQNFIQFLQAQQVDYHLGVTTTDTFNPLESGHLINNAGLPQPWVSSADGANAQGYFVKNATVGEMGTGDEKGLLGGMFALTAPLSPATPASSAGNCVTRSGGAVECFIRPDAALYTILISDEEDSSCSPGLSSTEGCSESDIIGAGPAGYGSIDYWSRFFSGAKGLTGTSRFAAITAVDSTQFSCATEFGQSGGATPGFCDGPGEQVTAACSGATHPDCSQGFFGSDSCCQAIYKCYRDLFAVSQWCNVSPVGNGRNAIAPYYSISGSWQGCESTHTDPTSNQKVIDFVAYYAPRYATVATNTGGIATSICQADYTPALAKLGLQASGLRSDFPLSRAPIPGSISVLVDGQIQSAGTWSYVGCENHVAVNVIRFTDSTRPKANQKIAASYDVNVRGLSCP
jgi:hypothetical protein